MAVTITCEICGHEGVWEGTGAGPKTCTNPECKRTRLANYHRAYKQQVRAANTPYAQRQRAYVPPPAVVERNRERQRIRSAEESVEIARRTAAFWANLRAEGYVGLREAARIIGIEYHTLSFQQGRGAIASEKRGRYVVIAIAEVRRYIKEQSGKTGRSNPFYGKVAARKRAEIATLYEAWAAD